MRLIYTLCLVFLISANILSQYSPGAKQISLANSDVALSNDVFTIFSNPAGLAQLNWREVGVYYSPAPFGLSELANGYVAYHEPFEFGSITINKEVITHDVIINLAGEVKKRKKRLSKEIYGTSHIISLDEAKYVYEKGAKLLIFGAGQYLTAKLSDEAAEFLKKQKCTVNVLSTIDAASAWNKSDEKKKIGLFHITC